MERLLLLASILIWHGAAVGEPGVYRASIELHSKDVPAFIWHLDQNLEISVSPELLSESARALSQSAEFVKEIQMQANGLVGLVTYRIAKAERGVIVLSFTSGAWSVVPICEQMLAFSEVNESAYPPHNCQAETLEWIEA